MPGNEWSEPMQTAWQEFEAQVRAAGQQLHSHLPLMLKAEVTTLEAVEMVTQKITQVLGQTMVQSCAQEIVQTATRFGTQSLLSDGQTVSQTPAGHPRRRLIPQWAALCACAGVPLGFYDRTQSRESADLAG